MIENRQIRIKMPEDKSQIAEAVEAMVGNRAIRWYVSKVEGDEMVVEASLFHEELHARFQDDARANFPGKQVVLSIVPTGIGCEFGGYAGDAAPITNLLAATCDYLVTNPNAVNASNFISLGDNVVYTDGATIDMFCRGKVDLRIPTSNRIGLIVEQSPQKDLDHIMNVVNAVRAIHGVNISDVVVTDGRIGSRCEENKSGAFVGEVDHPEVMFKAAQELLDRGCQALAITTNVQDLPAESYAAHFAGRYPNPVGGVEAIISNLLQNRYRVPVAHAPLINFKEIGLEENVVDARGAGEIISESGLACILIGLRRSPQSRELATTRVADMINYKNLQAVVAPASSLGGLPIFHAQKYDIPVIAVRDNGVIFDVTHEKLGLSNVIEVSSYAEAAGMLLALRKGISIDTIQRPIKSMRVEATVKAAST